MDLPFKIIETDLKGDCSRLNRLLQVLADNITPATALNVQPVPIQQPATANITFTTSYQIVPGMTFQLTKSGWWKFDVTVEEVISHLDTTLDVIVTAGAASQAVAGGITLPGILQSSNTSVDLLLPFTRQWLFKSQTGAEIIQIQGKKVSGTGNSGVAGSSTPANQVSIVVAVWVGP
jgi:hypothetical protein